MACRRQVNALAGISVRALPPSVRVHLFVMSKQTAASEFVVDVRALVKHPGAHRHVTLDGTLPGLATPVARVADDAPIHVDAEVESVVEGLLVSGEVTTRVTLQCARCLGEFERDLRVRVRELFALHPGDAEEEGYALLPDDRLPMDTMIRDAVVLAFPSAPLHSPDCAGLCPVCGADRNVIDCGHQTEAGDPRWAALAGLDARLAGDGLVPPAGDGLVPPAGDGLVPPAGDGLVPPTGSTLHTEEEDDARP